MRMFACVYVWLYVFTSISMLHCVNCVKVSYTHTHKHTHTRTHARTHADHPATHLYVRSLARTHARRTMQPARGVEDHTSVLGPVSVLPYGVREVE